MNKNNIVSMTVYSTRHNMLSQKSKFSEVQSYSNIYELP